jgi:hypothetical protein
MQSFTDETKEHILKVRTKLNPAVHGPRPVRTFDAKGKALNSAKTAVKKFFKRGGNPDDLLREIGELAGDMDSELWYARSAALSDALTSYRKAIVENQ